MVPVKGEIVEVQVEVPVYVDTPEYRPVVGKTIPVYKEKLYEKIVELPVPVPHEEVSVINVPIKVPVEVIREIDVPEFVDKVVEVPMYVPRYLPPPIIRPVHVEEIVEDVPVYETAPTRYVYEKPIYGNPVYSSSTHSNTAGTPSSQHKRMHASPPLSSSPYNNPNVLHHSPLDPNRPHHSNSSSYVPFANRPPPSPQDISACLRPPFTPSGPPVGSFSPFHNQQLLVPYQHHQQQQQQQQLQQHHQHHQHHQQQQQQQQMQQHHHQQQQHQQQHHYHQHQQQQHHQLQQQLSASGAFSPYATPRPPNPQQTMPL
eukprot:GHVS01004055.1.p1 GENE.GHVS01004055.1~~GHVS01004055.1.p1  ORF type:complete len:315 (-),score=108.01 GHVS01004055.1:476-1420(-)